jgi:hypothetical protein
LRANSPKHRVSYLPHRILPQAPMQGGERFHLPGGGGRILQQLLQRRR